MNRDLQDKISEEIKLACEQICLVIGAKHDKIITLPEFKVKIEDNGKKIIEKLENE
jgi:hypothetical protein